MRGPVLPYALSVHGFINKIGNDAGFAAIIAVAILIIMVFVQARETSLVRDRAEDAEDRLSQLEQYAAQVGRQATAAQQAAQTATAQATQAAQAAGGQATRAGQWAPGRVRPAAAPAIASHTVVSRPAVVAPFAPLGVGAPALSSATRLIPQPDLPVAHAPALAPATAPVAVAPAPASVAPAPAPALPPALAASTVAAGTPTPPSMPVAPSGRGPRRDYGRTAESEPRSGRGSLVIAAILVAVIIVAAVLVITHHSSSSKATRSAQVHAKTTGAKAKHGHSTKGAKVVQINPTQVRVAVLNGTATDNLAADVSTKLNKVGFQQGETANFANPNQTSTTVGYLPGDRAQAIAVAKALGIGTSSVAQVSTTARQIVCPSGAAACADQIVVTVGANLNSDA
jgi:hypothetical protein